MAADLDWGFLAEKTENKRTKYRYEDVQHLVRKVAFDRFKPIAGQQDSLWELREEDGAKYLYAVYDEAVDLTSTSSTDQEWQASSDRDGKNITLSFKQLPLMRFSSAEFGFAKEEAADFAKFLQSKTRDSEFVNELIKKLPETKQAALAALLNGSKN